MREVCCDVAVWIPLSWVCVWQIAKSGQCIFQHLFVYLTVTRGQLLCQSNRNTQVQFFISSFFACQGKCQAVWHVFHQSREFSNPCIKCILHMQTIASVGNLTKTKRIFLLFFFFVKVLSFSLEVWVCLVLWTCLSSYKCFKDIPWKLGSFSFIHSNSYFNYLQF